MAASTLTIGEWTPSTENNLSVWSCTVTATTADYDIYTKKTPKQLDPHKPWTLVVNSAAATLDATSAAIPVDLYVGWDDTLAITENNAPVVTGGVLYKVDIIDDVRTSAGVIMMDSQALQADAGVIASGGMRYQPPIAPYYAFGLDCASALSAGDCTFKIIQ